MQTLMLPRELQFLHFLTSEGLTSTTVTSY